MHTLIISTRTATEHGTFIRLSERNVLLQKLRPNILWRNEVRVRVRGEGEVAQLVLRVCNEIISRGLEWYELLGVWA